MKRRLAIYTSSAVGFIAYAVLALPSRVAAGSEISTGAGYANQGGTTDKSVETTIGTIVGVAMWAIGIISVIMLIFAGIQYATAAGDEAKVKKAKNTIIGAIIGLAFAILASVIVRFVTNQIS